MRYVYPELNNTKLMNINRPLVNAALKCFQLVRIVCVYVRANFADFLAEIGWFLLLRKCRPPVDGSTVLAVDFLMKI